jgi:hypothetical protein
LVLGDDTNRVLIRTGRTEIGDKGDFDLLFLEKED